MIINDQGHQLEIIATGRAEITLAWIKCNELGFLINYNESGPLPLGNYHYPGYRVVGKKPVNDGEVSQLSLQTRVSVEIWQELTGVIE